MFSKNINGLNNKKKFKHGTKYLKTEINNYIWRGTKKEKNRRGKRNKKKTLFDFANK